jgi:DNA polymerase-1
MTTASHTDPSQHGSQGDNPHANQGIAGPPEQRSCLALSPWWESRLAGVESAPPEGPPQTTVIRLLDRLPQADRWPGRSVDPVTGDELVRQLVSRLAQRPMTYASLAVGYGNDRPGVALRNDRTWHDPRSIRPQLLALTLAEAHDTERVTLVSYALDCRVPAIRSLLPELFDRTWTLVVHGAAEALYCLWQMGVAEPHSLWDVRVAERALALGRHHPRNRHPFLADAALAALARQEAEEEAEAYCDLGAVCLRYGVPSPWVGQEQRLGPSFQDHPDGQPFTREQAEYLIHRSEAAAQLYPRQVQAALAANALHHLVSVEMPWVAPNARMTWDGVRVDPTRCQTLLNACQRHDARLGSQLASLGVSDSNSDTQLAAHFGRTGRLSAFRVGGGHSFDDDRLEAVEAHDPVAALVRDARKVRRLRNDALLTGELVGADGRLHPEHVQLGAATGRNTMRAPNLGGVGRVLRPLVIPDEGHGVGEADLCQVEVMLAAAVYGDRDLVAMANGRDIYAALARRYYAGQLPSQDLALPDDRFKRLHRGLRDRMKTFALSVIYGIGPASPSVLLNTSEAEAGRERGRFLRLFPALAGGMAAAVDGGALRGYAELPTGLRRHRVRTGIPTPWESNWLANTPVQGACSAVFKAAGARLYRRYWHYGARLLLPMHDAFVFEAPLNQLGEVARVTAEELRGAVQAEFPGLRPRVEVNVEHPRCWNKDGKWRSLALWMIDPALAREYLGS